MNDLDAFILIGGRSSRLGVDKAFVEIGGERLAARAARTVTAALDLAKVTFVAAADDQFNSELVFGLGNSLISDLKPGFGAWSGLHTALAHTRREWAFVLACDLPLVSVEFVRFLRDATAEEYDAIVPRQADGQLQPLCAFYKAYAALAVVESELASERLPPLQTVFDQLDTRIVGAEEYGHLSGSDTLFLNVNTAADCASLTELL